MKKNLIFQILTMNNSTNASLKHFGDSFCDNVSFFHDWTDSKNVSFRLVIITMFTLGLIGNITTVAVISCWRKLHTPTFTMLACLAVSDACSLLAYTPYMYTNTWRLFFCNYLRDWDMYMKGMVWITLDIAYFYGRYNAGMQLCILAFLRFTATVYPIKFKTHFTCKAVILMSVAGSVNIIIISVVITVVKMRVNIRRCNIDISIEAVSLIIPSIMFAVLHILKVRALRRCPSLNKNSSLKMNVVMSFVLLIYVASSTSILTFILVICHVDIWTDKLYYSYTIPTVFFVVNCASNPLIYFFSSPPIVQLFRKLRCRFFRRCHVSENGNAEEIELNTIQTAWAMT